ncbi:response regulator [Paenibacillus profundus]|uniref:Response regulator n=1 Tax=Paenibacillus profundus TaxID=1173085 RepID=A0ABS8YF22_9BACL|nr:response regulator [Paenibacillus profundus]MCE5168936.1 response regulator [Paenibacillus profundus]
MKDLAIEQPFDMAGNGNSVAAEWMLPMKVDYGGGARILVVEDDPVNIRVILHTLMHEKYNITVMGKGEEVLAALDGGAAWNYDLVLLDVLLPTISGYDICRRLREHSNLFDLPIIMLTARNQAGDALAGFEAGANDYVLKPMDGSELRMRIRTLLSLKQAAEEHVHLEMALWQAQMNPHFIYNTLNSIASLNSEAPDQAQVLLIQFGNYLRASFRAHNRDRFIPFAKEWALVQSYLYIEQVRFSDRLSVELDVADGLQFELPPLTLQPIVENAIRHGIMKRREGGTVAIAVRLTSEEAIITVADNGVGMRREVIEAVLEARTRGGIGLVNTHKRLTYWYGRGLCIRSEPDQGTEITMRIPVRSDNTQNGMIRMMEAGGNHSGIM